MYINVNVYKIACVHVCAQVCLRFWTTLLFGVQIIHAIYDLFAIMTFRKEKALEGSLKVVYYLLIELCVGEIKGKSVL